MLVVADHLRPRNQVSFVCKGARSRSLQIHTLYFPSGILLARQDTSICGIYKVYRIHVSHTLELALAFVVVAAICWDVEAPDDLSLEVPQKCGSGVPADGGWRCIVAGSPLRCNSAKEDQK